MSRGCIVLGQLRDFGIERLVVACDRCNRRGVYKVAHLVDRHGADLRLPDLLATLAADCPARSAKSATVACGAVYPELPVLFGRGPADV
jgi:hypothetical protein